MRDTTTTKGQAAFFDELRAGRTLAAVTPLEAQAAAPVITTQPQSRTVAAGSNATLTVVAAGAPPLAYQWFFNSVGVAGAQATTMTITNFQSTNQGGYHVVVTNAVGSVTSQPAWLYLDWPLRFVNYFVNSNGLFQARLIGPAGSNFIIQGLIQGSPWTSVVTNNASNGIIEFTEPMIFPDPNLPDGPTSTNRFYRARLAP